jgi:hypothetical protein
MKHAILVTVFAMVCGLTAIAQTGTTQSSPQTSSPSTQPQTDQTQNSDMQNQNNGMQNQNDTQKQGQMNGERKLKGCILSQGGSYTLQTKHGKEVPLTGSADFASHVGHTVTVHGTYESKSSVAAPTASAAPTGSTADNSTPNGAFMVSKVDMVSESCKDNNKDSSKMKGDKGQ